MHADSPKFATKRGLPPMNFLRTVVGYGLLTVILGAQLFIFEIPVWLLEKLVARNGNVFLAVERGLLRWFFRLYPFGRIRRVNIRRGAFPRPCVIVANHQSLLDIPLLMTLPSRVRFAAPLWFFKLPMLGEISRLAKHIEYSGKRNDPGLQQCLDALKRGDNILFLPEGRRSPRGAVGRFHDGAFDLAQQAGVPIVPVLVDGTGAALHKETITIHPLRLSLKALAPIETAGKELAALKAETRAAMTAGLAGLRERRGFALPIGMAGRLAAALIALLIGVLVGVSCYVNNYCIAKPPTYSGSRELAQKKMGSFGEASTLGDSWRMERGGLHVIGLSGDPWEIGYANAKFTPEVLKKQEDTLLKTVDEFVPNGLAFWVLKNAIGLNNRDLPNYVSDAEKLEILGLTEGSTDYHPNDVPLYHRVLNYHAAHDISHLLIDSPLVARREMVGCTGLAAWGKATTSGDMLMARNFDWEAGDVFDQDKVVFFVWPKQGIPFCHVAWAGMVGCVTGINAKGIACSINAARTEDFRGFGQIGTPVSMLVRRVLEHAATLDEAEKIIREAQVFCSDSFLIADGKRAIVIEKSPGRVGKREAAREGLILQTNHFLTPEFTDDKANRKQQEQSTTLYRMRRLEELTEAGYGKMDERACLDILRDRKGMGGKNLGLGNRNAIDGMICTHSVIMNVSKGWLWVSEAPHTLGWYRWFDALRVLDAGPQGALRMAERPERDLPRDVQYYRAMDFDTFKAQLKFARTGLEKNDLETTRAAVMSLENVNPDSFETAYWRGRYEFAKEKFKDAQKDFELALERDPHYEEVRADIKLWLQRATERAK